MHRAAIPEESRRTVFICSGRQSNRVVLNMSTDYNPSSLARAIKMYFEHSKEALEVIVLKGKKKLSVTRDITLSADYYNTFMKRYIR